MIMERYYVDFNLTFDYYRLHPEDGKLYFVCDSEDMMSSSVKDFKNLKQAEAYCLLLNMKEKTSV